jgi:hypothetical protein
MFKDSLIAPLFHHFYPGHIFFPKPSSLVMVLAFFQWIRLSYPGFKDKLAEVVQRPNVSHLMKVHLQDLMFLCEFAIPTVYLHICSFFYISFYIKMLTADDLFISVNKFDF